MWSFKALCLKCWLNQLFGSKTKSNLGLELEFNVFWGH